jgi:hypothetical protein
VKVWDTASGQVILTLPGHTDAVISVAFSPDGQKIASGSRDHSLKVWDASSGQEILTLLGHTDDVNCVAFSPDGQKIVSGSRDQTLIVWDASGGPETLTLLGHAGGVNSVAFSPDSNKIVSGGGDQNPIVWDASTGQDILTLKGHTNVITSVAFSPDGKQIVSGSLDNPNGGSLDKNLKVWDALTGQEILALKGHTNFVTRVAYSPDGKRIVSGSGDNLLKLWDASSGQETLTLKGHTRDISGVAFSRDGKTIISSSLDGTLKVWDASQPASFLSPAVGERPLPHTPQKGVAPPAKIIRAAPADPGKEVFSVSDKLTRGDLPDRFLEAPHKAFTFKMEAGRTYIIDLVSHKDQFLDNYLRLEDSTGQELAEDDNRRGDLNARIFFRPSRSDNYRIIVTSVSDATGAFTLTIRESRPAKVESQPPKVNEPAKVSDPAKIPGLIFANGFIRREEKLTPSAKNQNYEVKMAAGKTYQIDLKSKDFDAFLLLKDANGKMLAEDDDSGGELDSRIVFRAPVSGTYQIVASSLGMEGTGAFVLEVREQAEGDAKTPWKLSDAKSVVQGQWAIVDKTVMQTKAGPNNTALLTFGDPSWTDFDVELEAQTVEGINEFALCFRVDGPRMLFAVFGGYKNTYHVVLTHAKEGFGAASRFVPGRNEPGRWYHVRLEARGSHFQVFFDGQKMFDFHNDNFARGNLGLRTVDTIARFRNIRVTDPEGQVLFEGLPSLPGSAKGP